jgi:Uma2 family endonuclease
MCPVVIASDNEVRVPGAVTDLESFRRWAYSDEFPEQGRIAFLQGEVWVDMSPERLNSHSLLKSEFYRVLNQLARDDDSGKFFPDGALWTHERADISTEPDGMYISWRTFESGRARFVGKPEEAIEIVGSPDMVLEVVSDSSVRKDTVVLVEAYWRAGVREYWLVDARRKSLNFQILARHGRAFRAVPSRGGWQRSAVFQREFKLTRSAGRMGVAAFELQVR